jgi:hypothetical protein
MLSEAKHPFFKFGGTDSSVAAATASHLRMTFSDNITAHRVWYWVLSFGFSQLPKLTKPVDKSEQKY